MVSRESGIFIIQYELAKGSTAIMTALLEYSEQKLYYWLWYNYQCHEGTSTEFQRMFENIMSRIEPEFMRIRTYGRRGDRKADGLFLSGKTVYQVYSPDDVTQDKTIAKIDEDLDGAVDEWGEDMEKWIFVYNVRRGVPPDVPTMLIKKQNQYPNLTIDYLSKERLWDLTQDLPIQQLAEIFGAPAGYEKIFLPKIDTEEVRNEQKEERIVLIQDVNMPIDVRVVLRALEPRVPFGAPVFVSPEKSSFAEAKEFQKEIIENLQSKGRHVLPAHYAVFSLAPIPLIAHLGFLLTDSVGVDYFKFHVDTRSWSWPSDPKKVDTNFQIDGLPEDVNKDECEVAIRISISAKVWESEVEESVPEIPIQLHIYVDKPSITWIRSVQQVKVFASVFREVLTEIRDKLPNCRGIHLFFAGPAPIVLAAGQQVNPRMNPPVHLYEYSRQTSPRYKYALTLK
jgi:hypothetical protein